MARNHASALRLVVVPCGCSIIRATALADVACGYKVLRQASNTR